MKIKKILLILVICLGMFLLASCNKTETNNPTVDEPTTEEQAPTNSETLPTEGESETPTDVETLPTEGETEEQTDVETLPTEGETEEPTDVETLPTEGETKEELPTEDVPTVEEPTEEEDYGSKVLEYSFDNTDGQMTLETISNKQYKISYVFGQENADYIFKETSDPVLRNGVKGNALYMDGFSTKIMNNDFDMPGDEFTVSSWIAPRVFENVFMYGDETPGRGHTRLTAILSKGEVELGEGFLFGYGRLGMWGIQLALHSSETDEDFVIGFYDPINALPLYEWSHISATFNGNTGYICLSYNGQVSYEAYIPELIGTSLIETSEPLYMGYYCNPMVEFGVHRQIPAGLIDEVMIHNESLSPKQIRDIYGEGLDEDGEHPYLPFSDVGLDSSVYEGDRYRPQYHAIPPAVWMNEPHSPFYYNGKYHVLYQHNPSGPYWSQIRWGHLVSDDMIHWEYVKDAVVPTKGICPEGVWTGGAVIGPDGTPWLVITAGTNQTTWSNQNIAFAHCADPNDPYLTDWIVEEIVTVTQPSDDSQGEREQFRDPFVWYDDGLYYMIVSTSVPHAGGSGNIYTSTNLHEWEYKGYVFELPIDQYPIQGAHWECVVMLPITTKDGSQTKWILFDCPQYTVDGYVVECLYWIGEFDKNTCRFIPDDPEPKLFDMGVGIYTGQNGYCFLTEEDIQKGKTNYEDGRTIIYAIAQGKAAGTKHNELSGWAHNFAIPLELYLADNGKDVIREPIKEIESLYGDVLFNYDGRGKSFEDINTLISEIRGDTLRIDMNIKLDPTSSDYRCGLNVRYNPNVVYGLTERTSLVFNNNGVYIDRALSSLYDTVDKSDTRTWNNVKNEYQVTILLDRSMFEVYIDGVISFTTRIYPKYGDSDYLNFFAENVNMTITHLEIISMNSAYTDEMTPPYYGNTGNLTDLMEDGGAQ